MLGHGPLSTLPLSTLDAIVEDDIGDAPVRMLVNVALQSAAIIVALSTQLAWEIHQQDSGDLPVAAAPAVVDEQYWENPVVAVQPTTYLRLPLGEQDQFVAPTPIVDEVFWAIPGPHPWPDWNRQPFRDPNVEIPTGFPGVGPSGAASFVLDLEAGMQVKLSWSTDVMKAWNGLEQRVALLGAPKQHYDGSAYLADGDERTVRTALLTAAAQGQAFLIGLTYEELTLSADAAGTQVNVWSTALCDWKQAGQRVLVIAPDGTTASGVVQSSTAATIVLDTAPGAAGKREGRIMPAMAVYLEPQQGLARHPVNVAHWNLAARAALFGFANVDTMGVGATLNTFAGFTLYDYRVDIEGTAANSVQTLGEMLDAGALPLHVGGADIVDMGRQIRIASSTHLDWQWFKLFVSTVRGRQQLFLLPTWRPDLVFHSNPGASQLLVKSSSVAGAGNYMTYFASSQAQGRLQIRKTDGTIQYVSVANAFDNGDGTITLTLDATVTATVQMISFLEICRLESDDVTVTWDGWTFESTLIARVVQQ